MGYRYPIVGYSIVGPPFYLPCPLRDKPPVSDTIRAVEQLKKLSSDPPVSMLDPVRDLKLNDLQFVKLRDDCQQLATTMTHYSCSQCPLFTQHVSLPFSMAMGRHKMPFSLHGSRVDIKCLSSPLLWGRHLMPFCLCGNGADRRGCNNECLFVLV